MGLVDYDFLAYGPNYTIGGDAAVLTTTDGFPLDVKVIDETAGVEVLDKASILTILPAVRLQASELAEKDIAAETLAGATLAYKGDWLVVSHQFLDGKYEVRLILEEKSCDG
ncbi:MAG: hypothetical protein EOQ52_20410 [Mesorhizobium sp.]|uniref:hypothetical protein n=1 Tax=Mesorhizobium sp. TaxID=1871066 RepID=UPI000FE7CA26|nr:hypothetical protein [Mesorhizobium sp.]RWB85917.1 MAG: hypothetical protein EOQ52_20410 [Mesorhizobium sp.]